MRNCDVAIVGAGPYGLSVAAHLKADGVSFRIFGRAMEFWQKCMPKGMHLKSEGFASSLYEPSGEFTLGSYCKARGLEYADIGNPVPLEVFSSYGLEFQERFVPELEEEKVVKVERTQSAFLITLQNGETLEARRVVVAVGQTYYAHLPQELASLPREFVTHSSEHSVLNRFKGLEVIIVGAGASALDLAALLHEAGASVQVVARVPAIRYHDRIDLEKISWLDRLRNPITGIGPGWRLWLCTNLPLIFRRMPESFRVERVQRILGPAPCWFIRERVQGKVGFNLGATIKSASIKDGRVALEFMDKAGSKKLLADHLIAATGFRPSLQRLTFLAPAIAAELQCVGSAPALSSNFESSVRDLYFVGVTAANTFGPMLRFAYGAGFAAPRVSRHLKRTAQPAPIVREASSNSKPAKDSETVEPVAR